MPVTIGVGVSPGQVEPAEGHDDPRFNRSFESDGMNDSLARFVLEEVLPAVEAHKTPDGLPILLSKDGDDRCTGGASTGGIGAFTLAWQKPEAFRRIFTAIGTFVGMRGGDQYPVLVRKTEPKGFRIFMQDGSNDEWMGGPEVGDWWMANQSMVRSLEFSGYDIQHVFGHGTHNGNQATQQFPDAMRFLWKDWPQPTKSAAQTQNQFLGAILTNAEGWKIAASINGTASRLASNRDGMVGFDDTSANKHFGVSDDPAAPQDLGEHPGGDMAQGAEGQIAVALEDSIECRSAKGEALYRAEGIKASSLTLLHDGSVYAADPGNGIGQSKIWRHQTVRRKNSAR